MSIKPYTEEVKKPYAPEPRALTPPTPPDMDEVKNDIVGQIKDHIDSLRLDDKYQDVHEELSKIKDTQKKIKHDLNGKLKLLRNDFEEWKNQEPTILIPDPNKYIHIVDTTKDKKPVKHEPKIHIIENSASPKPQLRSPSPSRSPVRVVSAQSSIRRSPSPRRELTVNEKMLKLRFELPRLNVGEEVLAKWPDDGWYYRSIVKEDLGDCKYQVEDSLRDVEQIFREDIISEINDSYDAFESGDLVVALHPQYDFSYAPGQIVQVSNDMSKLLIRFYDFVESVVLVNEVYKLPRIKFQVDIDRIIELEKRWIGQTVVARNNYSNVYEIGRCISRLGNGRQYTIEWSNGRQSIQNANHIFGKYTRNQAIIKNDYVLAPKETIFLPGKVLGRRGNQLRVRFVDGLVDENINHEECFWLSRDYYEDACKFFKREINHDEDEYSSENENDYTENNGILTISEQHRATPVIHASDFYTGRSNRVKFNNTFQSYN